MRKLLVSGLAVAMGVVSFAQTINLTTFADNGYTQNFDTLTTSTTNIALTAGGGEFNNGPGATLPGWYYGNSINAAYNLVGNDGGSNTGRYYSYGSPAASTERALGTAASGTPGNMNFGARFVNGTGTSTGLFVVQFDLEQWRNGGNLTQQGLRLSYKLNKNGVGFTQTGFISGTDYSTGHLWTQTTTTDDASLTNLSAPTLNNIILGPIAGASAAALNGNLVANSVRVRAVVELYGEGLSFDPGDEIVFRWSDLNDAGNDHGFGIDNVEVVPEPASMGAIGLGIVGLLARRRRAASK